MSDYVKISAIVLAGKRPGADPLATHFGVAAKALIPVAGKPMVDRVVAVLHAHPEIGDVHVLMPFPGEGQGSVGMTFPYWTPAFAGKQVTVEPSGPTIAATVQPFIEAVERPLLITTADDALLNADILDSFLKGARRHDLAVGVVAREALLRAYPESRRTWLRFRGGAYSGANLFWVGSRKVLPVLGVWRMVEQRRKRGRALIGAFGPLLLTGVALRLLTLEGALNRLGKRYGMSIAPVILPQAEACIDVDSIADHALVERILAERTV